MISTRLFAAAAMLGLANATCQLGNSFNGGTVPQTYTSDKLCHPQGEGSWTFAMYTSEVEVPTFDGGNPNAGNAGNSMFLIYDNACNLKGGYSPAGNKCGIPFIIEENFLADVLTISSENLDVGNAHFVFEYGNGKYSIGNNHCTCGDMGGGLAVNVGCKCAFPVSGMA